MNNLSKLLNMPDFEFEDEGGNFLPIEYSAFCKSESEKRNAVIVECPKCGVTGNEPNMLRWHFDNCTTKFRICEQCGENIPRQGIKPFNYDVKKYCNRKCYMASKIGKAPITMTDDIKQRLSDIALTQSKDRSDRIKKSKPWNIRWKK
jgi:hypothetical protein